ncbi:Uncharacterized protein dnl_34250 [Desulfonema limicola]|uniref:Uncharacterized protein n=1 Tax=Desulfonema limicola TaxID=45656 RepID=A0A975B987_9BACT|nr:hypothetical protein [Desulfonema limicola]QTA81099.1 Uncharacterized protein dnl_34250 [Desulfonema limicola]
MTTPKLKKMINIIAHHFNRQNIPFAAIGAIALGLYGLPRYTADIDLLAREKHRSEILRILEKLGFSCFNKNNLFAQFDSEMGVFGHIDLMFASTPEGDEILNNSIIIADEIMGDCPVIQPEDYIVLKLMAIANNPERKPGDEADIISLVKCCGAGKIHKNFNPLNQKKIFHFAERFKQKDRIKEIFDNSFFIKPVKSGKFFL